MLENAENKKTRGKTEALPSQHPQNAVGLRLARCCLINVGVLGVDVLLMIDLFDAANDDNGVRVS